MSFMIQDKLTAPTKIPKLPYPVSS